MKRRKAVDSNGINLPSAKTIKALESNDGYKYRMGPKNFIRLEGCGIKSMWMIFNTEVLIYQSETD